jgi:hypothetical protein
MLCATIHQPTDLSTQSLDAVRSCKIVRDREDLSAGIAQGGARGAKWAIECCRVARPPRKAHGKGITVDGQRAKSTKSKEPFRFLGVYSGKIFC